MADALQRTAVVSVIMQAAARLNPRPGARSQTAGRHTRNPRTSGAHGASTKARSEKEKVHSPERTVVLPPEPAPHERGRAAAIAAL
jgi:hypothetical protein